MTANQIAYMQLEETRRANRANEAIKADTLTETERANRAKEGLSERDLTIKDADNIFTRTEQRRHNLATEAETQRANKATERLRSREDDTKRYGIERSVDSSAIGALGNIGGILTRLVGGALLQ